MTLSDLASIGTLVSGVAVALSLIFVLLQMRQNDQTLRATMQQSRTARYAEQILRPTEPYLCEAVTRALRADMTMDAPMIMAFVRHAANIFWNSEDVFLQHISGTIDHLAYESDIAILRNFLQWPAYRVGWEINRDNATGEFKAFVDKLVGDTKVVLFPDPITTWQTLLTAEVAKAS